MTLGDLAIRLRELQLKISPSDWYMFNGEYILCIKVSEIQRRKLINAGGLVTKVCTFAQKGTAKTPQRIADAEFICLVKNNLPLIIEALNNAG